MRKSLVCLGFGSWLAFVVAAPLAAAGEGSTCTSDEECGEGYACELNYPPSIGGVGGASGDSSDVEDIAAEGECSKIPVFCQDDSDCPESFVCERGDTAGASATCDSNGDCTSEPVSSSADDEPGICMGVAQECDNTGDCPSGSACTQGVCAFDIVYCEDNTDCDSGYECLYEVRETCGSSSELCAAGEQCDTAVDTECVTEQADYGYCFPPPVGCDSDSDCENDDICYDIPADGPEGYAELDNACWPPGLAGAMDGTVALSMDGELVSTAGSNDTSDGDPGTAGVPRDETSAGTGDVGGEGQDTADDDDSAAGDDDSAAGDDDSTADDDDSTADDDDSTADDDDSADEEAAKDTKKDEGGCSVVRAPGSNHHSVVLGALLAFVALSTRRRRRA